MLPKRVEVNNRVQTNRSLGLGERLSRWEARRELKLGHKSDKLERTHSCILHHPRFTTGSLLCQCNSCIEHGIQVATCSAENNEPQGTGCHGQCISITMVDMLWTGIDH